MQARHIYFLCYTVQHVRSTVPIFCRKDGNMQFRSFNVIKNEQESSEINF